MRKKRTNPPKKTPKVSVVSTENSLTGKVGDAGLAQRAAETVDLVPQPHGGALLPGGKLGNKGGGSSPEEIKGSFRKIIAEKGLPWVERMLNAPETVVCPKCGTKVKPPAADGVRARLLDTATRTLPQQVEQQGIVVIVDKDSLSV